MPWAADATTTTTSTSTNTKVKTMNYAIFNRHTGALLWAGKADNRRAALAELAGWGRLSASDMGAASDWADIRPVSDELLPFLDDAGVHAGVLEADAMMKALTAIPAIDAPVELRDAADMGALAFYFMARDTGGAVYHLAWQPSIRRAAIQREGSDVVFGSGDKLIEALVEHFAG